MKKILLPAGILFVMLSCNNDLIKELEAENSELKTSIKLCQKEAIQQKALAKISTLRAFEAQKIAEEQYLKLQETAETSKK